MATALPSTTFCQTSFTFPSQNPPSKVKSPSLIFRTKSHGLIRCSAKKKISFVDQILDYIEGGPKLRKWYGAPDLLPKDGSDAEEEDELPEENGVRDAVLVTDGDSEIGQMIILTLIVKKARVKALVKDKRTAMEAFGAYVESMAGDASSKPFLKKALRGVRAIICPNESDISHALYSVSTGSQADKILQKIKLIVKSLQAGIYFCVKLLTFYEEGFLSNGGDLQGVKHVILLSQLSVYRGSGGIQALMKNNARKLAEQDDSTLVASGIPYTIIRVGMLQDTPGGTQGFSFEKGSAEKGSLSKEDAAFICVEALDVVPQVGFTFEVGSQRRREGFRLERAVNQIDGEIRAVASLMFLNSRQVNVFLFLHLLPQIRNPVFYNELAMGDLCVCCHEQSEQLKTIHQSSVLLHHHVRTSLSNMTFFLLMKLKNRTPGQHSDVVPRILLFHRRGRRYGKHSLSSTSFEQ
ncbi:hypothetical protein NC651_008251 [Populus alba x Populus x berolinensis]|nr:hypothetical protein NC651_008251 [Populus alba x Populus x berolinensis]